MTSPADLPPPPPERGNPARLRITRTLLAAAGICLLTGAILTRHDMTAAVCVFTVAGVCLVAAVAVLAGKGRQS